MGKAQASTEFLAFMAISIAMLGVALGIYSVYSDSAMRTQRALEAQGICMQVASDIGSFAALGDGAEASFTLPKYYSWENYTIRVVGGKSLVKVDYSISGSTVGVGCHYPAVNVANEAGASEFTIGRSYAMRHTGTVVIIGQ